MANVASQAEQTLTWKDFVPDVDVRWCPGCGDYAILNSIQKVFPTLGIPRENFVVVSGIGCASRFPYYMDTYGLHSIHGRAPAFAMGIKVANPELSVWLVTGDGDGLSIGGNHLMHLLRRNLDVTVLLFNNRIYGLTKGQYSPTSELGHKSPSSPQGSIDHPINPLCFALASEATFVARTIDTNPKHMTEVFKAAAAHRGTAFVEILQNCVIFNNGTWTPIGAREVRDDQMLDLQNDQPLLYGKEKNMGIRLNGTTPEIVKIGDNAITEKDILRHDQSNPDPTYAYMITQMAHPKYPTPVGVFRAVEGRVPYNELLSDQIKNSILRRGRGRLQELLRGSAYWQVDDENNIEMHATDEKSMGAIAQVIQSVSIGEEFDVMNEQKAQEKRTHKYPLLRVMRNPLSDVLESYGKKQPLILKPTDSVSKAIHTFNDHHEDCILIIDRHPNLVGILSARDIVMKVTQKSMDRKNTIISMIMIKNPEELSETASIGQAFNMFSLGGFRHLPVRRADGSLALLTTTDLLFYIYDQAHEPKERRHLDSSRR
jgi:2-oxoglutarate ferredoxin oxidoreductase subunit beta